MKILPALLCAALGLLTTATAHAQAARLKIKARQVTEQPFNEKRTPSHVVPISDRTMMVMIDRVEEHGIRDHKRSLPRFELYDRGKITHLRGQDPVNAVRAGDLFVDHLVLFRGRPVMLAMRRDTVKGTTEIHQQKLDVNLTRPHPYFDLLGTFDTRTFGDGTVLSAGSGHHDRLGSSVSPDGGHLLVYSPGITDNDGDVHRPLIVVGEHMVEAWHQTVHMEDDRPLEAVQVDNAGVVHLLERVRVRPEDKRDTTRVVLRLMRADANGITESATGLAKGHWIKSAVLRPAPDGRVLCAGIYGGLNPRGEPMLGEFTGLIAPGGSTMENVVQHPFELDRADAVHTNNGMRITDVLPAKDGGLYLVREYFLETDAVDAKTSMSGLRWIHGPVVVTRRDAAGAEQWSSTFRRLYYSTDPLVGNVLGTVVENDLVLFLLDSEALEERRKKDDKALVHTDLKNVHSAYVHFTAAGESRAKSMLSGSSGTSYIMGDRLWELAPGDLIALGASKPNGKGAGLVRIELGE